MTRSRFTTEEIIKAYMECGSVWKAAKSLGLSGQTVHERLRAVGYKLANSQWTDEEVTELKELAGQVPISVIASRLGRPYAGVAKKIQTLGIGSGTGSFRQRKPKRTEKYFKHNLKTYIDEIDKSGSKVTTYAKANGLDVEKLAASFQAYYPDWWLAYSEAHAVKDKTTCPYCETEFWPLGHKQIYCTRKCGNDSRVDNGYFGGKRRETIGLAEKTCQLCGRKDVKGLSSHHMIGKENDPENEYLVALCPGCHNLVTLLGGRNFTATPEIWEGLIQLVLIRKNGANPEFKGVYCFVEIEPITDFNEEGYESVPDFIPQSH
jgi:hypothetical protein